MVFIDKLFLGVSGILSLILIWVFITRYEKSKERFNFYYILGFALILSCSILIIIYDWLILDKTLITIFVCFIPLCLSLGLVNQYFKNLNIAQIIFSLGGSAIIILASFLDVLWLQYAVYAIVIIAFLLVLALPIIASVQKRTEKGFWWVGVGGIMSLLLLGLLYLYISGTQIFFLHELVILAILAPVYSLTVIALFWGFMQDEEETEEISE